MAKGERIVHRVMSGQEYKETLGALGLTQNTAAILLGYSLRMSRRYAAGEWPPILAGALRLMAARRITPDEIRDMNLAPRRDGAQALDHAAPSR